MLSNHLSSGVHNLVTELSSGDYQSIQRFLSQNCGIVLPDNKQYLVRNRLLSLLSKFNLASYSDLVCVLLSGSLSAAALKTAVIDAMTTNETYWFRDEKHFDVLKNHLFPSLLTAKTNALKIWSAACSSGQEPYSMAMTALEAGYRSEAIQIIGTDISDTVLTEAKAGVYSELVLSRGIDATTKAKYFQKHGNTYQINSEVRHSVRFQTFNLLNSFTALGRFDIIFCRNVLIYFSAELKRDILLRMADNLEAGGYLFLSSTESMPVDLTLFEVVHLQNTTFYKKK